MSHKSDSFFEEVIKGNIVYMVFRLKKSPDPNIVCSFSSADPLSSSSSLIFNLDSRLAWRKESKGGSGALFFTFVDHIQHGNRPLAQPLILVSMLYDYGS